ncbi:AzlD domain-containing protein [Geothermobacter hydrogeniphilus]|uniref:AzlD domain-containing protein n=1 Tax=Geothermobacter hydrogeniphilus TaxID=1969733 RepID=A0A2K2H6A5_9BACT|nr:AzlD domain-containing protein [Geothermobacter hydrogeniphilus]PNU18838.1 AzlD domain-containing protein [Geothermobacter hydrogeniphilus]
MSFSAYLLLLLGMGAVTYLPRLLPLLLLSQRQLPRWLVDWLELIPVAILAALLAPSLLIDSHSNSFNLLRPEFWVAVPTFLFAIRSRSLGGTVLVGMGLFWLAEKLL